jgi:hypothetical protein
MFNVPYFVFGRLSYIDCKKDATNKHGRLLFRLTNVVSCVPTMFHFAVNRVHAFKFNV